MTQQRKFRQVLGIISPPPPVTGTIPRPHNKYPCLAHQSYLTVVSICGIASAIKQQGYNFEVMSFCNLDDSVRRHLPLFLGT